MASTKHAPKGRIKGEVDTKYPTTKYPALMDPTALMNEDDRGLGYISCTAKSKQSGVRCKRRPIPGGTVCVIHGGGHPRTREKAMERLRALQHPAVDTLAFLMEQRAAFPSTAYAAARDVLDRTEGKAVDRVEQTTSGTLVIKIDKPW